MISSWSPRSLRSLAAAVAAAVVLAQTVPPAAIAHAQPAPAAGDKPAGDDDPQLYSCGKARGPISVTLRPETEPRALPQL